MGLVIVDLEADQTLQDLVLSVYHATTLAFDNTTVVKIVENHLGKAFMKMQRSVTVPFGMMPSPMMPAPAAPQAPMPTPAPTPAPTPSEPQPTPGT